MKPAATKAQTVGRKFRKVLAVVRQQAVIGEIKWRYSIIELQCHEIERLYIYVSELGRRNTTSVKGPKRYC